MTRTLAFITLLFTLLAPMNSINSFGVEVELAYEWDSGTLSVKKLAITPPNIHNKTTLSDIALYEAAIIAKVIGSQIVLTTTKDPEKTALLTEQLKTIITINAATEAKIKKENAKKIKLVHAADQANILAKNKLSQILKDNGKEVL